MTIERRAIPHFGLTIHSILPFISKAGLSSRKKLIRNFYRIITEAIPVEQQAAFLRETRYSDYERYYILDCWCYITRALRQSENIQYELKMENGTRPDILLEFRGQTFLIEIKTTSIETKNYQNLHNRLNGQIRESVSSLRKKSPSPELIQGYACVFPNHIMIPFRPIWLEVLPNGLYRHCEPPLPV